MRIRRLRFPLFLPLLVCCLPAASLAEEPWPGPAAAPAPPAATAPPAAPAPPAATRRPAGYATLMIGAVVPSDGDTGFSVDLTLGRYLNPYLAVEGSVGYYQADYAFADGASAETTVWPLALSLKAGYPVRRLFPYVIAGADLYFVDSEIAALGRSDSDTATGYHLAGGAELSVSRNVYVGLEYRYSFVTTDLFGAERELDGAGWSWTFGVRF